jgi:hypothetical protein
MPEYDKSFMRSLHELVIVAEKHQLPTPLAISWRPAFMREPAALVVQVAERDFASWAGLMYGEAEVHVGTDEHHVRMQSGFANSDGLIIELVTVMRAMPTQRAAS